MLHTVEEVRQIHPLANDIPCNDYYDSDCAVCDYCWHCGWPREDHIEEERN